MSFFKLEGLAGDSQVDQAHQGWFDMRSFVHNSGPDEELTVTLRRGTSSGNFLRAVLQGTKFPKGIIELLKTTRDEQGKEQVRVVWHQEFDNLRIAQHTSGIEEDIVRFKVGVTQ